MQQTQAESREVERLIEAAESRIGRAAAFYGHWFGRPASVAGDCHSNWVAQRRQCAVELRGAAAVAALQAPSLSG